MKKKQHWIYSAVNNLQKFCFESALVPMKKYINVASQSHIAFEEPVFFA